MPVQPPFSGKTPTDFLWELLFPQFLSQMNVKKSCIIFFLENNYLEKRNIWLTSLNIINKFRMTKLGEILRQKSIKKSDVSRKTGISTSRLSQLSNKETTNLRVDELYLIALAIDVPPIEILNKVCQHLKLTN